MMDPRAEYGKKEDDAGQALRTLFFLGCIAVSVLSVIAAIVVWSNKKILKRAALAILYASALVTVLGVALLLSGIVHDVYLGWALFFFAMFVGATGIIFGLSIAWYAQGKIDESERRSGTAPR